jgi:hypothetical protein
MFYPEIKTSLGLSSQSPSQFIQTCIEEDLTANIQKISLQGGSANPQNYIAYSGEKVEYLCYTTEYYSTCVMQKPMLKNSIEKEISLSIENTATQCFSDLKKSFESKGYSVSMKEGDMNVELLPNRVIVSFNNSVVLTKDSTERYDSFKVVLNNNLYELVSIASSILNSETSFGDAETTTYMNYYRDLKVEKLKQTDGSKIYILTDRTNQENKFQFATRSVVWPPGYGLQ